MSAQHSYDSVEVGNALPSQSFQITRADLVRYAGASGDFNVIHWNQRIATSVGLPDVIAHGMLTMALAVRVVTDWAGDPGAVVDYGVRFTRPVPVPDDDVGAAVEVSGTVAAKLDDKRVRVDLTATHADQKVLGKAQAVVQLDVTAPEEVRLLARRRQQARAERDFAAADALRDEIGRHGWQVHDTPDGFTLTPRPAYDVAAALGDLPDRSEPPVRRVGVGLLVEGWPDDLRSCVEAVLTHPPDDVVVVGLDVGNVEGAGDVLHELAEAAPGRVEEWHVAAAPGWGAARAALLRLDRSEVHVVMETSTVLEGDALTPLLTSLSEPAVVGAGWRGVLVDLADDWRSFVPAGAGEVDALLGYLLAVRREAALEAGVPDPRARGYRNADLEMSLALREQGGRLVVPPGDLPVRQERHRGFHDTDPGRRDREARKTYDRLLARFRGRDDILSPR